MLNPMFNQQILNGYLGVFNRQARCLLEVLHQYAGRGPFDCMPHVYKNALETICETTLDLKVADGTDIKNKYVDEVDKILNIIIRRYKEPWLYFDTIFQWSGLKRMQDKCIEILHNELNQVLQRRRSELKLKLQIKKSETNEMEVMWEEKNKTFLEVLLEQCGSFADQELKDHVNTIIVSGYDTVATALLFTTIMIGSYPRVQERLLEELQNVFNNTERDITKDDLPHMVYLDAVIKESLRIYSVIPGIARKINKDVKLSKTYAMMSLKTTLVHLLRRYEVSANHMNMVLKMDILLKPAGHQISINQRC